VNDNREAGRRRTKGSRQRKSPGLLERIQPDAAGIDCGAEYHYVAVPPDRDPEPVRPFRTFTADLERLADWLAACGVKTVAMESTGVYWIPLYELLEARGFQVVLVNARDVRNVPGRKSDVADSEWLRELHRVGGCCGRASGPPVRSLPYEPICATARPWCTAPPPTSSACRRRSCR